MKLCLPFVGSLLMACTSVLSAGTGHPAGISGSTEDAARILTTDTPLVTSAGHGFIAPAGWSVKAAGSSVVLTAPEGGSHIVLVDVIATDAEAAVAAAWAAYDAQARPQLESASDGAPRNGWEQIRNYRYATAAKDRRETAARVMRHKDRWIVAIRDMTTDVMARRDAQLELIFGRLQPKGYTRESFAGRTAHTLDAARVEALKQFVDDARRQFDVPGVAIGIVQGGKVVLTQGFGVRELGKPETVDADTLFMIASNTKPLTTLMLAKLVDAGRFTWETPVTQVLPTFKLGDADTTRKVLMKHLVCACTGLPRQDMEWVFQSEDTTAASALTTLATMKPTSGFGEIYQYANLPAAAAGFVGGHALYPEREMGAAYDAAMQTLVFDPLGMKSTTLDFDRALRADHASPHSEDVDGMTVPASMDLQYTDLPIRPEGGAWSNVNDLLRYVQMELDKGLLPDGTRYIAEAPLLARRVQQASRGNDLGYGIGLKIDRSSGTTLLHHGGSMFGFISDVMWLPEHNVGAVILTNADQGGISIRGQFRRRLLEVLFDGQPEAVTNLATQSRRMKEDVETRRETLTVPADPALVRTLAGRYHNAELGNIDISRKGATTWLDVGGWRSEMASRRNSDGTAALVTISPGLAGWLEFAVAVNEARPSLVLHDEQREYVFVAADNRCGPIAARHDRDSAPAQPKSLTP